MVSAARRGAAPVRSRGRARIDELRLQAEMRLPQLAIVDALDSLPDLRFGAVLVPACAEMPVVEAEHLRSEPGRHMHAVGDMADRNGVFGLAGIQAGPHVARYFAVQGRDSIGAARDLQSEHRHAEIFVMIAGIFAAELHQRSNATVRALRATARDALR